MRKIDSIKIDNFEEELSPVTSKKVSQVTSKTNLL